MPKKLLKDIGYFGVGSIATGALAKGAAPLGGYATGGIAAFSSGLPAIGSVVAAKHTIRLASKMLPKEMKPKKRKRFL